MPRKANLTWIRDLARLAAWYPGLSIAAALLTFLAGILEGAGLAALVPVMNAVVAGQSQQLHWFAPYLPQDPTTLIQAGIVVFIILAAGASLSRFLSELLQLRLRAAIERRARGRLTHALLSMSWPSFISIRQGDVAQAQFTEGIQMGTGAQMLVQAAGATLASLAYIGVALAISPRMTGYTLAYGLLVAGLYAWFGDRGQRHSDALSGLASQIGKSLGDLFGALKFARATGLTAQAEAEAASLYERWRASYVASQAYVFAMRHGFEVLGLAFIAIFLLLSAAQGREGLAAALVFLAVFYRLAPRLLALQEGLFQARASHGWYRSWSARLAEAEGSPEMPRGERQPELRNSIELRDVCFKYPGSVALTLTGVSMKVAAGELVGIVGPSGEGKTTLLDLLPGLLEPSSGAILIDGVDLRDVDMRQWRSMLGLVPQEPLLVHGDFTANICWGDPAPNAARARDAACRAGLLRLIEDEQAGMATQLGDRGSRLSGGQRQRLALARALYRDPAVLILDEPTSALDRESQAEILKTLSAIKGRCTTIVVTHSDEVSALCDKLYRLDGGGLHAADPDENFVAGTL